MSAKRYLQLAGAALVANSASLGWTLLPTKQFCSNGNINSWHVAQQRRAIVSAAACAQRSGLKLEDGGIRDVDAMLSVCARLAQEGSPSVASLRARISQKILRRKG